MKWLEKNVDGSDLIIVGVLIFSVVALVIGNDTLASAGLGMVGGYVTKSVTAQKGELE